MRAGSLARCPRWADQIPFRTFTGTGNGNSAQNAQPTHNEGVTTRLQTSLHYKRRESRQHKECTHTTTCSLTRRTATAQRPSLLRTVYGLHITTPDTNRKGSKPQGKWHWERGRTNYSKEQMLQRYTRSAVHTKESCKYYCMWGDISSAGRGLAAQFHVGECSSNYCFMGTEDNGRSMFGAGTTICYIAKVMYEILRFLWIIIKKDNN